MSISPQGYTLGGDPQNINPFWGEDEQTNWTIEAEATVDNTSGSPSVNVETDTDTTLKKKTFTFEFSGLKGEKGDTGKGIQSITKTGTSGLVDTYTITFTDGTTTTFNITNGEKGDPGIGEKGDTGNGISSITKTATSGLVDTYTISFTDGTSTTFTVTNGAPGSAGVGVPAGGTTGQVLKKKSGTDYDTEWANEEGGGGSGSTVSVTQIQTTGTKIATITVDNVPTDLYAPEGGSGGSGTIEGDATVKWAGKALTTQPTTYPYKQTSVVAVDTLMGNATPSSPYTLYDGTDYVTFNVTFDTDYDIGGTQTITTIYKAQYMSDSYTSGQPALNLSNNSITTDNASITIVSASGLTNPTISGTSLRGMAPSTIEVEYNGNIYTANRSGEFAMILIVSNVATRTTTYDVMEAIGIGLVVNESDFTSIVGKVVNKLRCTFENATYYIQNIPTIKVQDGTTASIQITAGAGILYFDNMEFNAVSNTVWGHGMLRVVVPNSGGEYDFQGAISLQCTDANSIVLTLGRGTLTHSNGNMYITTGNSSAFTVNRTTCSLSNVYAEVI